MDTADFFQQFPLRSYEKDRVIWSEGDTLDTVLFIRSGYVKVTSLDASGAEHMLWIAASDDFVPSENFFSLRSDLRYFYTALTPVEGYAVDKAVLLASVRERPGLMATIAAGLSDNYDDLLLRIDAIDQSNIHDRLVTTLRYLVLRFGGGKTTDLHQIGLHLTHQDIAELIGSTRETTSLELEKMRQNGQIDYDRTRFVVRSDIV